MEKKISASVLAEELASRCNAPQSVSDDFVRAFFDTIVDGLCKDGLVKIKGLGTFKLSEVSDRESVDVTTGERIVIKGFRKVTFTPEAALKERINRPFSQFETVELADECHFDDVQEVIATEVDDAADEQASAMEEMAIEVVETPQEEPQIEEPEQGSEEEGTAPIAAVAAIPVPAAEPESETADAVSPEESSDMDAAGDDAGTAAETPCDTATKTEEEIAAVEEAAPEPEQETVETELATVEAEPAAVETEPEETSVETEPAETEEQEDFVYYTEQPRRHRSLWRYWVPSLFLVLAACCLYIYIFVDRKDPRFEVFHPSENDMIKVQPITFDDSKDSNVTATTVVNAQPTAAEDKASPTNALADDEKPATTPTQTTTEDKAEFKPQAETEAKAEVKPAAMPEPQTTTNASAKNEGKPYILALTEADKAKNLKDVTAADTTEYIIDGTLVTHELQKDETIIRLALMYYGDKRLWPYIVKYNWLKNPDSVPVGTALNIPYLKNK